jgi:outer membrane protein assembly factor BamD (BamD/ComL family)
MTCLTERLQMCGLVLLGVACASAGPRAQSAEELARRTLESGRSFMRSQNYGEAIKDFESVLQRYPTSSVADDAVLELALYQLDVVRNPAAADARAKELLKTYSTSDSAPMAYVIQGRVALENGRGPEQINAALADFDRVARLFPGTQAVPASMYYGGEAARLGGRRDQAIQRFTQLATQFPNSPWSAKALLGAALSLTRGGQAARAMELLQSVRNRFVGTAEATRALDWNSILYRLYLRVPAQPPFMFSGRTIPAAPAKLRDVADIAVDADSTVLVASKSAIVGYGVKGNQTPSIGAPEPRTLTVDRNGNLLTVHETGLRANGTTPVVLMPPAIEGRLRQLKIEDAAITATGEYLVADSEQKSISRFTAEGRYLGEFAGPVEVRRMAISELDDVAVLNKNSKSVTLYSRDGKVLRQIAEKGANYQLRNPVDVAFDPFGHLYVMDRIALLVFSPDGSRLLSTFTVPEKAPGAIGAAEAMALDRAGRVYVFDSRADSVKVYR